MTRNMLPYAILQYIVDEELKEEDGNELSIKLPPIGDLARELRVSRGKLREELIVAQAYSTVEMRPGDGTYVLPFDFYSAIQTLVLYSIALDRKNFDRLYQLRVHLETTFWEAAARRLDQATHDELFRIVEKAERKLQDTRVEIPHKEHRDFHLRIFGKLDNTYVQGLLEVYWDAYEAVGLNIYFDYSYYQDMWSRHRAMVEALVAGRYEEGKELLVGHFTLLDSRLQGVPTDEIAE